MMITGKSLQLCAHCSWMMHTSFVIIRKIQPMFHSGLFAQTVPTKQTIVQESHVPCTKMGSWTAGIREFQFIIS